MIIGILEAQLRISGSQSLKEKRTVIKSLKDRLRNSFNVSVAETAEQDKWQLARIGVVAAGSDKKYINSLLCKVVEFIENNSSAELIDYEMELI